MILSPCVSWKAKEVREEEEEASRMEPLEEEMVPRLLSPEAHPPIMPAQHILAIPSVFVPGNAMIHVTQIVCYMTQTILVYQNISLCIYIYTSIYIYIYMC